MSSSKKSRDKATLPDSESSVPAVVGITEESAKRALIDARGDIFVASQILGTTAIRLQRAIQVSPVLQATVDAIPKLSKGVSEASIHEAIEQRVQMYRAAGLDALHELATIDVNDTNSAKLQVKLAAAARLAGSVESAGGSGLEETLRELNKSYQENAPRLRVIRERTTVEIAPPERVVSEQDASE